MKKELHFIGEICEDGSVKATKFKISKSISEHSKNTHLKLVPGQYATLSGCVEKQPADTPEGYYVCSAGQWIFVPYS